MATATELIAQAQAAATFAELDAIEAQANGRVTVLGAVADRRTQLMPIADQFMEHPMTTTEPTTPAAPEAPPEPDFKALAEQAATTPRVPTVPSTLYFTYTKPDGTTFLGSAASAEYYLRKDLTISGEETIDDLVTYYADKAKAEAATPAPAPSTEPSAGGV